MYKIQVFILMVKIDIIQFSFFLDGEVNVVKFYLNCINMVVMNYIRLFKFKGNEIKNLFQLYQLNLK